MKKALIFLPILSIIGIAIVFFHKFFLRGLLPIPADIITGVYYPWLDYKWGNLVGVAVKNPLMSDIPSLIYPWRTLAIDLIKNLQWPLWNQYSFSGYPLLGNWQSAPFSLANMFYLFTDPQIAWSLGIITQPLLASYFIYLWLRNKKLIKLPALLGGFLYAFSGFHITWMFYNTHGWTTLWLPLILLSIDKTLEINKSPYHQTTRSHKPKNKLLPPYYYISQFVASYYIRLTNHWTLILSLSIALSILSGYPIILVYEAIIILLYLIWNLKRPGLAVAIKQGLALIPATVLGLGISAIQWIPGLETIQQSIHDIDTSTITSANQGYLPIQNLITVIAPDFFGNPATYNYWGIGYYDNWAFYMSIGGLMLALFLFITELLQISQGKLRKANYNMHITYYLLLITLLGIILATLNPIGNFITNLIPILKNSIHSRALFLTDFGIAVAAAYGLQILINRKTVLSVLISIAIMAVLFALLWSNLLFGNFLQISNLTGNYQTAFRNLIIPTGLFITVSGIMLLTVLKNKIKTIQILFGLLGSRSRQTLFTLLCLMITIDIFRYFHKYLPFTSSAYLYPPTAITDWLNHQKTHTNLPFRVEFGEVIPENMWIPYRLESPAGYDALMPLRYGQFLEVIQSGRLNGNISRFPKIENLDSKLFELTNTKYVLAVKYNDTMERTPEGTRLKGIYDKNYLKPVYEHGTVIVLENQHYLPRAFVVPNAEMVENDDQLISILTDPSTDFLNTVFLSPPEKDPENLNFPHSNFQGGVSNNESVEQSNNNFPNYSINWTQTTGNTLQLTVNTNQPGYLVLLESYNPGWRAFTFPLERDADGNRGGVLQDEQVPVYRSNFTFMSLPLEPGASQITLTYFPNSFKYGLYITGISVFIWISLFIKAKLLQKV